MSRPFCPKENCLSKFYANFNRQFIICGVSHTHRHPHFFGLVLILAFVQILVLIGIFEFLALAVKIVRKIGAFLFLGLFPDFLGSALTIAHSIVASSIKVQSHSSLSDISESSLYTVFAAL